jgi:hypothetical protein
MNESKQEIDLISLILSVYMFLKRNIILLSILTFIGFLIGFYTVKKTKPYYTASIVLGTIANEKIIEDIIVNSLNYNKSELQYCENLLNVGFQSIEELDKANNEYIKIKLNIMVSSPSNFDTIFKSIVNYLEKNDFIIKEHNIKINKIEELISFINSQMEMFKTPSKNTFGNINIINYNVDSYVNLEIKKKDLELQYALFEESPIIKIHQTPPIIVSSSYRTALKYIILFFIFATLIAGLRELHILSKKN